jgi:hypothetical protein
MSDKPISREVDEIELHPDAWERFERVDKAAAKHQVALKPKPSVIKKGKS